MAADIITRRIFLSHAWPDDTPEAKADHKVVRELLEHSGVDLDDRRCGWVALPKAIPLDDGRQVQLQIFFDQVSIPLYADLTNELRQRIAESHLVVACWSERYPTRGACTWELGMSVLAAPGGVPPWLVTLPINIKQLDEAIPGPLLNRLLKVPGGANAETIWKALARVAVDQGETVGDLPQHGKVPTHGFSLPNLDHFVGRAHELWQVWSLLHTAGNQGTALVTGVPSPNRKTARASVRGLGGVGKSMLAQVYAYSFGSAYPGGIFWLNAFGNDATSEGMEPEARAAALREQLRTFANELGLVAEGEKVDDADVQGRIVKHLGGGQPYLWLVDDLPNRMPAGKLKTWFAPTGNGHTLLTSRGRILENERATLHLGVLDEAEAVELLTGGQPPLVAAELEAAKEIAVAELGGLPLALSLAAALTADDDHPDRYQRFLAEVKKAGPVTRLEADQDLVAELPTGHERSILFTFVRSFEALGDEGAWDVLRIAAQVAQAPLPIAMVEGVLEELGVERPGRSLVVLRKAGLTEKVQTEDGLPPATRVHTLVARAMRLCSEGERLKLVRTGLATHILGVLPRVSDVRTHRVLAGWLPHAQALVDETETGLEILGWLSRHDLERGNYAEAQRGYRHQWEAHVRLLGSEHPDTLTSRNNLASTLKAQGDLSGARSHQEAVWEARARLLGSEHPDTLTSRGNLASTLKAQGDLSGARSHQEAVWEARARLLGSEHPDTLTSRGNLAGTLKAQGDLSGARSHQEAVWEAEARLLGSEHPSTLTSRGNLAQTLKAQGDLSGARSHQEAVWEAEARLLGSEHPSTLTSRGNLAQTLKAQGDLSGARSHEEAVWEALARLLGSEHPSTLTSRLNLAGTLFAQGDLSGARSHEEAVWEAEARLLGSEHPSTLTSRLNLAGTLFAQGDLSGARSHQEAVWEARARLLGPRHSDTTLAAWNLFITLRKMQAPEATEVFQSGLAWVLSVEPDLLSHQQQQIQAMLHQMISQAR